MLLRLSATMTALKIERLDELGDIEFANESRRFVIPKMMNKAAQQSQRRRTHGWSKDGCFKRLLTLRAQSPALLNNFRCTLSLSAHELLPQEKSRCQMLVLASL